MEHLARGFTLPSPLLRTAFLATALPSALAVLLVYFALPESFEPLVLGTGLSLLIGMTTALALNTHEAQRKQMELLAGLAAPLQLAPDSDLFTRYLRFVEAITGLSDTSDPLHRELAMRRVDSLCEEVEELAQGRIAFRGTETWRTAYRELLEGLRVKSYLSVSWVRTGDYWNDAPGRHSMRLNYELLERGFRIERILILSDDLWPFEEPLPTSEIRPWIDEQQLRGVSVLLVRESDLAEELDLRADFGIYGDRAVGVQELDEHSRTLRFLLLFDKQSRQRAHDRWTRLLLFAAPFAGLLNPAKARQ